MFRKYMIFILAAFMIVGTNACTSKKASDDSADVEQSSGDESIEAADAGGGDNSDGLSTGDSGAVADLGGANDDLAPEEKLPDDKAAPPADAMAANGGDQTLPPAEATGDVPPPPADQAAAEPAPPPEPGAGDAGAPPMAAEPAPPGEPMAPPVSEPATGEAKPVASLQKMKQTPWKQGKTLLNAIYIARKGDSPESISQKVFGSKDKVKDLCKANSYNCSRPAKVGDKFYYNSPQRPTDDQVVKTFYEDAGIAPQMYTAKQGDNIRKVGKELLGHERSWQELWATNDVESKGDLDEGTKLRYWPDTDAAPAQTMAKTDGAAPTDAAAGGEAPPAEGDQAANTPPPPPPPAEPAANQAAAPPPPPPPPADALPPAPPDQAQQAAAAQVAAEPPPPPPPPPADQAKHGEPAAVDGGQDPNQTMALGVGAVLLLAAAALFISIRKKRARRQIDFNTTTQTQIE